MEKQITLPWGQVARIAFNSLRVRLFRSAITIGTLTLAVSFVVYTWAGYEILNSVFPHLDEDSRQRILARGFEQVGGRFGTGPKEIWLAILSLLVCVTGVVNAHLMAVTERFREIGTLKCLGALDSFVMKIFVLESVYQGFLAGVAGNVLGIFTATLMMIFALGSAPLVFWPAAGMAVLFGWALLLSVFLSTVGVIYPALVAARMQPVSAMRAEQ